MTTSFRQAIHSEQAIVQLFCRNYPALITGVSTWLAFLAGIDRTLTPFLPLGILLFFQLKGNLRFSTAFWWQLLLAALAFTYACVAFVLPDLPESGVEGTVHFCIESVSPSESHFGKKIIYSGKSLSFWPKNAGDKECERRRFPCKIAIVEGKNVRRPPADRDYLIEGVLKKSAEHSYHFLPHKSSPWQPIRGTENFSERRFQWKQHLKGFLHNKMADKNCAELISGMLTGQFEDRVLRAEFGKLGLLHLMAISGFHFTLLASFCTFFCRITLPQRAERAALFLLLTLYFFFLGKSASVFRAWVMCLMPLFAPVFKRHSLSLNALGFSLLLILLLDPLQFLTLGFKFSYGVTASILLFIPAVGRQATKVFRKRRLSSLCKMSFIDQHLYCVLSIFREGIVMMLAVNAIAAPLTLYYFGFFPLLGLLYNLFIPFLCSLCIVLSLLSMLADVLLPPVGSLLFSLSEFLAAFSLHLVFEAPQELLFAIRLDSIPSFLIHCLLTAAFFFAARLSSLSSKFPLHQF